MEEYAWLCSHQKLDVWLRKVEELEDRRSVAPSTTTICYSAATHGTDRWIYIADYFQAFKLLRIYIAGNFEASNHCWIYIACVVQASFAISHTERVSLPKSISLHFRCYLKMSCPGRDTTRQKTVSQPCPVSVSRLNCTRIINCEKYSCLDLIFYSYFGNKHCWEFQIRILYSNFVNKHCLIFF